MVKRVTTQDETTVVIRVLVYSDDWLFASTCRKLKEESEKALKERFDVGFQARANWYLQASISQDAHGNIYLDQKRYAASIIHRYILTSVTTTPTDEDLKGYFPVRYQGKRKIALKKSKNEESWKLNLVSVY